MKKRFYTVIKDIKILVKGVLNIFYYSKLMKKEPILIGGCGRSGTTFLLSILAAHPKIHGINKESGNFALPKLGRRNKFQTILNISHDLYLDRKKSAVRFIEKTPKNVNNINGAFKFLNGKLKFIHIVRDGREVITSKHPGLKDEYWVSFDRWINDVSNGLKHKNNENILLVRYEDLVNDFTNTIKTILDFIGEEMVDEVRNYWAHTTVRKNRAWDSDIKAFHKTRSRSENNEDIKRIKSFMEDSRALTLMKKLNYIE